MLDLWVRQIRHIGLSAWGRLLLGREVARVEPAITYSTGHDINPSCGRTDNNFAAFGDHNGILWAVFPYLAGFFPHTTGWEARIYITGWVV